MERVEAEADLERRHLQRLLAVAGLGLFTAFLAPRIEVRLTFLMALLLGLLAIWGLSRTLVVTTSVVFLLCRRPNSCSSRVRDFTARSVARRLLPMSLIDRSAQLPTNIRSRYLHPVACDYRCLTTITAVQQASTDTE